MRLSPEDQLKLAHAAHTLERPSFTSKVTKTVGSTVEKAVGILPDQFTKSLTLITRTALEKSLEGALLTLPRRKHRNSWKKTHQLLASISGAVGGAFGLPALAIELPVSTTIMLRSIADIARSHGEDIYKLETKLACLEVFALSNSNSKNNNSETGYYAIRSLLAKSISDAVSQLTAQGLSRQSSPALIKILNTIAARFSIPVSEKVAAQSIPAIGAIGGATINLMFTRYFQEIAEAHFTIRALEKKYEPALVKRIFEFEINTLH
jgi:hypothetical protein